MKKTLLLLAAGAALLSGCNSDSSEPVYSNPTDADIRHASSVCMERKNQDFLENYPNSHPGIYDDCMNEQIGYVP